MSTCTATTTGAFTAPRSLDRVMATRKQLEGGGFPVRRPPIDNVGGLFLLHDHLGPWVRQPGEGFPGPDHPHRGFITISYQLQGVLQHHCSTGHEATTGPGHVQFMEAGRGVVHGGNAEPAFQAAGGVIEGFQIWVNLPAALKMIPPRYQEIDAARCPVVALPGGVSVKVIAGDVAGVAGAVDARTPFTFLDVRLQPGATASLPVPLGHVGYVYVYRGASVVGAAGVALAEGQFATLGPGDSLRVSAPEGAALVDVPAPHADVRGGSERAAAALLLLSGAPITDPVARDGPFVMNTRAELEQAFEDYRSGKIERESREAGAAGAAAVRRAARAPAARGSADGGAQL